MAGERGGSGWFNNNTGTCGYIDILPVLEPRIIWSASRWCRGVSPPSLTKIRAVPSWEASQYLLSEICSAHHPPSLTCHAPGQIERSYGENSPRRVFSASSRGEHSIVNLDHLHNSFQAGYRAVEVSRRSSSRDRTWIDVTHVALEHSQMLAFIKQKSGRQSANRRLRRIPGSGTTHCAACGLFDARHQEAEDRSSPMYSAQPLGVSSLCLV